jgi:long-chain fatty acid transport protein
MRCVPVFRAAVILALFAQDSVHANGIYRNGVGGRSMSMGGADVAWAADPLGAMGANPAALGFLESAEFDLGAVAGLTEGTFSKAPNPDGSLDDSLRAMPEAALGIPLGRIADKFPVAIGLSFVPDSLMYADWKFVDPLGGLGGTVSYGLQPHNSEIVVLRSALGAGISFSPQFSFGVSVGLLYNQNHLRSPYTFQNMDVNPAANGAKTLLDLKTSGYGWDVQAGVLYRVTTNLQFGLSYRCESTVSTDGDANGDPYAQFAVPPGPLAFHYDANVKNVFPQEFSLGTSWRFHPQWRGALQVDWINWSDAFHTLPVTLRNGNNATVNSVVGANFKDRIPLNWEDQFVYRAGLEYAITEALSLRAGYSYGKSPVPDATLTPMTAAIMEHTITAGVGYRWKRYEIDFAYQYDLPVERNVGTSSLLSGEFSNSSTEVSVHWFALTAGVRF